MDMGGYRAHISPSGRAVQTADIALTGLGLPVVQDARLREIDLGAWNGQSRADIEQELGYKLGFMEVYARSPGESLGDLYTRCRAFLDDLTGPAVLVTHGITSRVLRALAMGQPPHDFDKIPGGQGVVYQVKNGIHKKL